MDIKHEYEHGSTRDVIHLLGISLSTFYRWLKSGALVEVFRTAGGHRRFDLNQLKAMFMNSELEHNRVVTRRTLTLSTVADMSPSTLIRVKK